jgi:hypothetical protein
VCPARTGGSRQRTAGLLKTLGIIWAAHGSATAVSMA